MGMLYKLTGGHFHSEGQKKVLISPKSLLIKRVSGDLSTQIESPHPPASNYSLTD